MVRLNLKDDALEKMVEVSSGLVHGVEFPIVGSEEGLRRARESEEGYRGERFLGPLRCLCLMGAPCKLLGFSRECTVQGAHG